MKNKLNQIETLEHLKIKRMFEEQNERVRSVKKDAEYYLNEARGYNDNSDSE